MALSLKNGKTADEPRFRTQKHGKLNLDVAIESKRKAKLMARDDKISVSRLFEMLVDRRWATRNGKAAA